jgi:hypothetical protein
MKLNFRDIVLLLITITVLEDAFSQPIAIGSEKFGHMIYTGPLRMETYQVPKWSENKSGGPAAGRISCHPGDAVNKF